MQQKLKSVDLQVENKFHDLLGEYHDNFLDKAM